MQKSKWEFMKQKQKNYSIENNEQEESEQGSENKSKCDWNME